MAYLSPSPFYFSVSQKLNNSLPTDATAGNSPHWLNRMPQLTKEKRRRKKQGQQWDYLYATLTTLMSSQTSFPSIVPPQDPPQHEPPTLLGAGSSSMIVTTFRRVEGETGADSSAFCSIAKHKPKKSS